MTEVNPSDLLLTVLAADLTPLQVDVFIDHAIEGRAMMDVAREYGCSHTAVRNAVDRGRRKLQRRFWLEEAAA